MSDESTGERGASVRVSAFRVAAETGLVSRRKLRRKVRYLMGADENKYSMSDTLELTRAWSAFRLLETPFWVRAGAPALFAYHKPVDEVTSRASDHGAPTVFDGLGESGVRVPDDAEPVGRLDRETSGLLLFTSDGTLLHRLTHPKYRVARTYHAMVNEPPSDASLAALREGGVTLRDGHVPRPDVEPLEPNLSRAGEAWFRVVLREGKYHEVRRAFAAVGSPVVRLHRVAYAGVTLGDLALGAARRLSDEACVALYESVGLPVPEDALDIAFDEPSAEADDTGSSADSGEGASSEGTESSSHGRTGTSPSSAES